METVSRLWPRTLLLCAGLGFFTVLALKLHFAARLDLYSDEVFYWLASTNPALAYSDLPFMTALLAGLGSSLDAGSAFAVRLPFILLGSLVPLMMYWLARPLAPGSQPLEVAILALCLPLGGFLGLLAVPDVPLIVFGLASIAMFERGLRLNSWRYWLGAGAFAALGLSTHYRFLLYPLAVFLFLLVYPQARPQWRNPRFWAAALLASCGLLPILWFNLNFDLSSASFYLVERHPWQFHSDGLLHLPTQFALVTPPLYLALLYTLWFMLGRAQRGETAAALLLSLSMVNLGIYAVLAPWADADSTSIHWPLSGYFPLLVYLPAAMRQLTERLQRRLNRRQADRLILLVPCVGFLGTLVAIAGVGSQAYQLPLQTLLGPGVLSNKMAGWQEFSSFTEDLLERHFADTTPLLITDNYYTAAQLEFAQLTAVAFTLDRDKAVRDGRIVQYQLWQRDSTALAEYEAEDSLFITEDSTLFVEEKNRVMTEACQIHGRLTPLAQLTLFNGDKRFSFYRGTDLHAGEAGLTAARPCPYPIQAWIDQPATDATLSGDIEIGGWAYNEDLGVEAVYLVVDGERVERAEYGRARPDVVSVRGIRSEPNAPDLGFGIRLDSRTLSNGRHTLAIDVINSAGFSTRYGSRRVTVAN